MVEIPQSMQAAIAMATKALRAQVSEHEASVSVATAKCDGLCKEMDMMRSTNTGLNAQVNALGKALDKMKYSLLFRTLSPAIDLPDALSAGWARVVRCCSMGLYRHPTPVRWVC